MSILLTPAEALSADEARAAEAEQIALQIRELVEGGRYKYEDISILFRATTSMYIYEQALKSGHSLCEFKRAGFLCQAGNPGCAALLPLAGG